MPSIISRDKAKEYTTQRVSIGENKTRRVIDNDDEVARLLRDKHTDEELRAVAAEYGLTERWDEKWANLNRGGIRMALGNALRKVLRDRATEAAGGTVPTKAARKKAEPAEKKAAARKPRGKTAKAEAATA